MMESEEAEGEEGKAITTHERLQDKKRHVMEKSTQ